MALSVSQRSALKRLNIGHGPNPLSCTFLLHSLPPSLEHLEIPLERFDLQHLTRLTQHPTLTVHWDGLNINMAKIDRKRLEACLKKDLSDPDAFKEVDKLPIQRAEHRSIKSLTRSLETGENPKHHDLFRKRIQECRQQIALKDILFGGFDKWEFRNYSKDLQTSARHLHTLSMSYNGFEAFIKGLSPLASFPSLTTLFFECTVETSLLRREPSDVVKSLTYRFPGLQTLNLKLSATPEILEALGRFKHLTHLELKYFGDLGKDAYPPLLMTFREPTFLPALQQLTLPADCAQNLSPTMKLKLVDCSLR